MSATEPRSFKADWDGAWLDVWRRDDPRNYVYDVYFDRQAGELIWVDNPNTTLTPIDTDMFDRKSAIIEKDPERYELIHPLTHQQHIGIFRDWVSGFTQDVRDRCDSRSFERFIDDLALYSADRAEGARSEWNAFHERKLRQLAETWLLERGFAVEWSG